MVYADNAATTKLDKDALAAMLPWLQDEYGNASQPYSFARKPKKALTDARATIAACIGAEPEEIYFTSGGTESDNWAIKGLIEPNDKHQTITSQIEHHAVLNACNALERLGYPVVYLPVDSQGVVLSDSLSKAITEKTKLVSVMMVNNEIGTIKKQFRKTDGRSYYHIVQAFAPDDPLDFDTAHEIGLKFAKYFKGYQCVVVTHMNTAHIHNHIIMNSVNFENGQKFHQSAREMQQAKEYSNQLCREYGLSFTESKADPFRIPAWKKRLCRTIKEAMENCATREEFIAFMAEYGYKVRWEVNQKYITYTTPENVRCRDNKLFDQTLLRSSMEAYFDMGGCEYLESRIDATEYGELLPTVDDAVCGLISILDAMNTGDNDRFHLETLHHSKQEIRRILERGGKIDRTVEYAVDDEDEEYEQYHGFSMRM